MFGLSNSEHSTLSESTTNQITVGRKQSADSGSGSRYDDWILRRDTSVNENDPATL